MMSLHASSSRVLGFNQLSSGNGHYSLLQSHVTDVVGSPAFAACSVVCASLQPSQGLPDTNFVAHGCAFGNFGEGLVRWVFFLGLRMGSCWSRLGLS